MSNYKTLIQENICYTDLVYGRINKKLNIQFGNNEIEEMVLKIIDETDVAEFRKEGKNIYVTNTDKNVRFTINSFNYRIITADKLI